MDIKIKVPDAQYRMTVAESTTWDRVGRTVNTLAAMYPRQQVLGAALSRITRELRRELGVEASTKILQEFAASNAEAAKHDR